jgi:hypothetical protein
LQFNINSAPPYGGSAGTVKIHGIPDTDGTERYETLHDVTAHLNAIDVFMVIFHVVWCNNTLLLFLIQALFQQESALYRAARRGYGPRARIRNCIVCGGIGHAPRIPPHRQTQKANPPRRGHQNKRLDSPPEFRHEI